MTINVDKILTDCKQFQQQVLKPGTISKKSTQEFISSLIDNLTKLKNETSKFNNSVSQDTCVMTDIQPTSVENITTELSNKIELIGENQHSLVLFCGDFNHDFKCNMQNLLDREAISLKHLFLYNGLTQIIDKPTFFRGDYSSTIDLVFTNDIYRVKFEVVENIAISCDHCAIELFLDFETEGMNNSTKRIIYDYNDSAIRQLQEKLSQTDFTYLSELDADDAFESFNDKLKQLLNDCVTKKEIKK
ncbi:hypothetical protein B4U79_19206, partial [Dinothrombium tinctorium]